MSSQLRSSLREQPPSGARQRVELGPPVVLGRAPLGGDGAFLLQLEQGGVDGAVVDGQPAAAGLLDPPGQPVAVLRAHRRERLQHHQGQRALPDVCLVAHSYLPLDSGVESTPESCCHCAGVAPVLWPGHTIPYGHTIGRERAPGGCRARRAGRRPGRAGRARSRVRQTGRLREIGDGAVGTGYDGSCAGALQAGVRIGR